MERKMLLYPVLAVLLGFLLVASPRFFIKNTDEHYTAFSRNIAQPQEMNESNSTMTKTNTYFTESLEVLQKLFLIFFVPLVLAYFVLRFAKSKYGL